MIGSSWKAPASMASVLLGCCGSVFFLELLVKEDPGCVNLMTFCSFLFVALEGFIVTTKCGKLRSHVPLSAYAYLVILYFIVSVINNMALNFNISMPLHMIFKGGALISNLLTGMYYFNRKYKPSKYVSVLMVSVGIAICTIESGRHVKCCDEPRNENGNFFSLIEPLSEWGRWITGVAMMTCSLFLGARMGVFQEQIYQKYGTYPKEALYYTHLLPLPGFLLLTQNIWDHLMLALESKPLVLQFGDEPVNLLVPTTIAYLAGYVITQYVCILSVFMLTGECTSLTVTLVLTLRKFLSLLFSVYYFSNPFTWNLGLGSILVFTGTLLFSDVLQLLCLRTKTYVDKLRLHLAPKSEKLE